MIEIFGFLQEFNDSVEVFKKHIDIQHDWVPTVVFALFAFMNSIRIFAYVPQLLRVTQDRNGASAISYSTWALFFLSHLTTVAFAILYMLGLNIDKQPYFRLSSGGERPGAAVSWNLFEFGLARQTGQF